tara:strand:+ start:721 stop:1848 length:1128 start_codon:yes stop_codon:yes gene_type:complete
MANHISASAAQSALSIQELITTMKTAGMADTAIRQTLLNDLNTGGPLFGSFRNKLKNTVKNGVEASSNGSANGKFTKAGVSQFQWISVGDGKACPDCEERHRETGTMEYFETIGLPASGFSVCTTNCRCQLLPQNYKGENLDKPLVKGSNTQTKFIKKQSVIENQILKDSKNKKEIGVLYDAKGAVLFRKVGTAKSVKFLHSEIGHIDMKKVILTHNHPSSASFSIDDIIFAASTGIKEMRAIAPESQLGAVVFKIKPKKGGKWPNMGLIRQTFGNIRKKYQSSAAVGRWIEGNVKWKSLLDGVVARRKVLRSQYINGDVGYFDYTRLHKKSKSEWRKVAKQATVEYQNSIGADFAIAQKDLADKLGMTMSWERL